MDSLSRRNFLRILGLSTLLNDLVRIEAFSFPSIAIPVFLYHEVVYRPLNDYTVKPHQILSQIELINSMGFISVYPWEVYRSENQNRKMCIITFDDGSYTFLEYVWPALKSYQMKAVINLIGHDVSKNFMMISWDELREIIKDGHIEIGCHGYNIHFKGWSQKVSLEDFRKDIIKFKEVVKDELNVDVKIFSSPFGEKLNKGHIKILSEEGFEYIMISEDHIRDENYWFPNISKNIIPRFNINYKTDLKSFRELLLNPYKFNAIRG